jgi:hypothetical protein
MMVTAKIACATKYEQGTGEHRSTVVTFQPDYADGRNKEWAGSTPSLSLTVVLRGEVADRFEPGHKYTLTFAPSE